MSLTEKSTTCFSLAKKDHHRLFTPVHSFLDRCSPIISPKFAQNVFGFYRSTLPFALWFTLSHAGSQSDLVASSLCLFLVKLSAWHGSLSKSIETPVAPQWQASGTLWHPLWHPSGRLAVPPSQLCDHSCDPTMTKFPQWEAPPLSIISCESKTNRIKVKRHEVSLIICLSLNTNGG